jgi:hypothetical protein
MVEKSHVETINTSNFFVNAIIRYVKNEVSKNEVSKTDTAKIGGDKDINDAIQENKSFEAKYRILTDLKLVLDESKTEKYREIINKLNYVILLTPNKKLSNVLNHEYGVLMIIVNDLLGCFNFTKYHRVEMNVMEVAAAAVAVAQSLNIPTTDETIAAAAAAAVTAAASAVEVEKSVAAAAAAVAALSDDHHDVMNDMIVAGAVLAAAQLDEKEAQETAAVAGAAAHIAGQSSAAGAGGGNIMVGGGICYNKSLDLDYLINNSGIPSIVPTNSDEINKRIESIKNIVHEITSGRARGTIQYYDDTLRKLLFVNLITN